MKKLLASAILLMAYFNAVSATIHQGYEGPWHWDELSRTRKSLDGSYYKSYEVVAGWADSGTAVITGRKEPVANMTIPAKIVYDYGVTGPWGVDNHTAWISLLTQDYDVTEIGESAFDFCDWLENVTMSEGLVKIGDYAFDSCESLTTVSMPPSVRTIGSGAFSCCYDLLSVQMSDGVEDFGHGAFAHCWSLRELPMPSGLKSIGEYAFNNCRSATGIVRIPSGVTEISDAAFVCCESLEGVEIPSSVTNIGAEAFSWCRSITNVSVPSGVPEIEDETFSFCTSLETVDLPSSVTAIGSRAFAGCSSLREVKIPAGVTTLGDEAFSGYFYEGVGFEPGGCEWCLAQLMFQGPPPSASDRVGQFCIGYFLPEYAAEWMSQISNGYWHDVEMHCTDEYTVHFDANDGEGEMDDIVMPRGYGFVLPSGTFTREGYTFGGWTYAANGVRADLTDGQKTSGSLTSSDEVTLYAFWVKNESDDDDSPDPGTEPEPEPVSSPVWTPVVQPDTVIGYYVVKNAKTDDFVEADGSVLGVFAADGECRGATRVTRGPGGLLFQLTIGVANSSESGFSFKVWDAATGEIHNVNEKISSFVGVETFGSILAPMALTFDQQEAESALVRDGILIRYDDPIVPGESPAIPAEVRAIGDGCFALASNLTCVEIPESVTNIGPYAFFGCSNLETVVFHEGLVSIDSGAFAECVSLGEITLPSSVRRVGDALAPTNAVAAIVWSAGSEWHDSTNFVETVDGKNAVHSQERNVDVHAWSLLNRGLGAFDGCSSLTNAILNEGLERLGAATFRECVSLTELDVPQSVVHIGGQSVLCSQSMSQQQSRDVDSLQVEGRPASVLSLERDERNETMAVIRTDAGFLEGCVSLKRVSLPQGLESLGARAFADCGLLREIDLSDSLRVLDRGTFRCCTGLERVRLPANLEVIGRGEMPFEWMRTYDYDMVRQNDGRASVLTEERVESVAGGVATSMVSANGGRWSVMTAEDTDMRYQPEDGTFYGCAALRELELPATVRTLCDYSFAGCNSLQLMFDGPPPTCGTNAVADCQVGFYLPERADQWVPVIVDGRWNGLEMRELSDVPSPATERSQDLTLSGQGWHEVSFAVLPEGGDPADVFAPVEDKVGYVTYGSKNWSPLTGGTLTALEIGKGYWVQTTAENVSWTVTGQGNPDVEIALKAGWNLIGYPLLEEGNIEAVLATALATGNIRYIYSGSRVYPGTLTTLEPGKGYWVYANAAATIRFDVK